MYLLMSIAFTVLLLLILKSYERFRVPTFPAIVVNYWVCVLTGSVVMGKQPLSMDLLQAAWLPYATVLGGLFVFGFYTIGVTLQKFNLAVATVMQKMSLVLSVPFGIYAFSEEANWLKISGLLLAVIAIFLTNAPAPKEPSSEQIDAPAAAAAPFLWVFPAITFFSSGAIECILQYTQEVIIKNDPNPQDASAMFTLVSFGIAAVFGTIALVVQHFRGLSSWQWRALPAGFILGVPNYFTIFFLLLAFSWADKSMILPINNVGILLGSTAAGLLLFSERLRPINLAGVGVAVLSIVLIALS